MLLVSLTPLWGIAILFEDESLSRLVTSIHKVCMGELSFVSVGYAVECQLPYTYSVCQTHVSATLRDIVCACNVHSCKSICCVSHNHHVNELHSIISTAIEVRGNDAKEMRKVLICKAFRKNFLLKKSSIRRIENST